MSSCASTPRTPSCASARKASSSTRTSRPAPVSPLRASLTGKGFCNRREKCDDCRGQQAPSVPCSWPPGDRRGVSWGLRAFPVQNLGRRWGGGVSTNGHLIPILSSPGASRTSHRAVGFCRSGLLFAERPRLRILLRQHRQIFRLPVSRGTRAPQ